MPKSKPKISANLVIAGLAAFVLLVVFGTFLFMAWRGSVQPSSNVNPAPVDLQKLHQDWTNAVAKQTSTLDSASDPRKIQSAVDALLALRVTSADREAHLNLVTALLSLERGDAGAWPRVQAAITAAENR